MSRQCLTVNQQDKIVWTVQFWVLSGKRAVKAHPWHEEAGNSRLLLQTPQMCGHPVSGISSPMARRIKGKVSLKPGMKESDSDKQQELWNDGPTCAKKWIQKNTAHLLLPASANNAVDAVKCSWCDKQDVGGVNRYSVATCSARAAIRYINDSAFKQLQHAL